MNLGVNIDHVATIRQARMATEPDPVKAALICLNAGCDSIVAHLREDRRHIRNEDIRRLRKAVKKKFNLEMSVNRGIVDIAARVRPDQATLVPEKRREVTTEGGLDVCSNIRRIASVIERLSSKKIEVSLFIDPQIKQIEASVKAGAKTVELHTGRYSNAKSLSRRNKEAEKIKKAVERSKELGLTVYAGHGLDYRNVKKIARMQGIEELNIGHSIISYAVFSGLRKAVSDMLKLIR